MGRNRFCKWSWTVNTPQQYSFVDDKLPITTEVYYRLKQIDRDGTIDYSNVVNISLAKVQAYTLVGNYPNPVSSTLNGNASTIITYGLPVDATVELKAFSVLGNEVATLVNELQTLGWHAVTFNTAGLPAGMYVYRLSSGNVVQTKMMVITK